VPNLPLDADLLRAEFESKFRTSPAESAYLKKALGKALKDPAFPDDKIRGYKKLETVLKYVEKHSGMQAP